MGEGRRKRRGYPGPIPTLAQLRMSQSQLGLERLFELERGLRSSLKVDQQKAFEKMPTMFNEYKNCPDVIEASVLRLIDFFKARSMERKLDIIAFLEKRLTVVTSLFNGEEAVRRLSVMWDINDPLMKSLIIRWFGLLCHSTGLNCQVQYRIGQSICSEAREEYVAAIKCLEQILHAVQPDEFAFLINSLCDPLLWRISQLDPLSSHRVTLINIVVNVSDFEEAFIVHNTLKGLPSSGNDKLIREICSVLESKISSLSS